MPKLKVKPEHAGKVFGFNNSAKPLGQRDDLHLLYADAKANNYQHILDLFEEVSETVLEKEKVEQFNKKQRIKNSQKSE